VLKVLVVDVVPPKVLTLVAQQDTDLSAGERVVRGRRVLLVGSLDCMLAWEQWRAACNDGGAARRGDSRRAARLEVLPPRLSCRAKM